MNRYWAKHGVKEDKRKDNGKILKHKEIEDLFIQGFNVEKRSRICYYFFSYFKEDERNGY